MPMELSEIQHKACMLQGKIKGLSTLLYCMVDDDKARYLPNFHVENFLEVLAKDAQAISDELEQLEMIERGVVNADHN